MTTINRIKFIEFRKKACRVLYSVSLFICLIIKIVCTYLKKICVCGIIEL